MQDDAIIKNCKRRILFTVFYYNDRIVFDIYSSGKEPAVGDCRNNPKQEEETVKWKREN